MKIDWEKMEGLIPAIVQDANSRAMLMLGYMNAEALAKTEAEGVVTFFSPNNVQSTGERNIPNDFAIFRRQLLFLLLPIGV